MKAVTVFVERCCDCPCHTHDDGDGESPWTCELCKVLDDEVLRDSPRIPPECSWPESTANEQVPGAKFSENDQIVTVYARKAGGPGWSNRPLWVIVRDRYTTEMREECIQPEQQPREIARLYDIAHEVDRALCTAVERHLRCHGVTWVE